MTTTVTADRIPLADLEAIITAALAGGDYAHDADWHRPDHCPCRGHGFERCTQYSGIHGTCQGYAIKVPTPEPHLVNLEILTAGLQPDPADGTVSAVEAASSILRVITDRLGGTYVLRAYSLQRRLTEQSELWEQSHGAVSDAPPAVPVSVLTCQWCQRPIPVARGPKARYCRNSHRVSAHRAKKRQQERQANG